MCGATQQQKDLTNEQTQFFTALTNQYNTVFGQNQAITGALTSAFTPILQAGPSQTAFAPTELNTMQTQNTENVATNYAQAQKATADILAARGGVKGGLGAGDTFLPSGVDATLLAQNANQAAAARAAGQLDITQKNYQQGYQNWQTAANVLGSTAGLLSPTAYSGQATGAGSAASTSAAAVAAAANSPWNAAFGALGAIGGGAVGSNLMSNLFKTTPTTTPGVGLGSVI